MPRLARRQRGLGLDLAHLAIDPPRGQRHPPRAQPPRRQLLGQGIRQPRQRVSRYPRIGHRLGQPQHAARRRLLGQPGQRLGCPPQQPVERIQRIVRLPKPARQAPPRHPDQRPDRLQPQSIKRMVSPGRKTQRRHRQRKQPVPLLLSPSPLAGEGHRISSQRPRRPRRPRHRAPRRHPGPRKPSLDIRHQPRLVPEQMRHPRHVHPDPVRPIDLDQRRPAPRPARQPRQQCRIPRHVRRHRDQSRIERPRIGQPHAHPRPARARRIGHRRDNLPMRPLDN